MLETMPNMRPDVALKQTHTVPIVGLCPVSGNPQPGSEITISYQPQACFLEVYAIVTYLENYVGGWMRDGAHIRDMEQTIQTIAADCARALGVAVVARAQLVLDTQRLDMKATGTPCLIQH